MITATSEIQDASETVKTAWTKGPWSVHLSGRGSLCVASDEAWVCGELDNQPHELSTAEAAANAHLIAASPDLYQAVLNATKLGSLQTMHDIHRDRDDHARADALLDEMDRLDQQIKGALAKARGEA